MNSSFLLVFMCFMVGCASTSREFQVSEESINPRDKMTWLGKNVQLVGDSSIAVGQSFPKIKVKNERLKDVNLDLKGQVTVVSVLPSLDTPVCDIQTHELSESKDLNHDVTRITISMDLPYAQNRFRDKADLTNISYFSDYAYKDFSKQSGLLIKEKGVLARAMIVVGSDGVIRHLQVVPEIINKPDMKKAFSVANRLSDSFKGSK